MVISCKCSHQLTEAMQSMFTYSMYRRLKKGGGEINTNIRMEIYGGSHEDRSRIKIGFHTT